MKMTMQARVLSAIGASTIAALIGGQLTAADASQGRRSQHAASVMVRAPRGVAGSTYLPHSVSSASAAIESKSCDRFWCYADWGRGVDP